MNASIAVADVNYDYYYRGSRLFVYLMLVERIEETNMFLVWIENSNVDVEEKCHVEQDDVWFAVERNMLARENCCHRTF